MLKVFAQQSKPQMKQKDNLRTQKIFANDVTDKVLNPKIYK